MRSCGGAVWAPGAEAPKTAPTHEARVEPNETLELLGYLGFHPYPIAVVHVQPGQPTSVPLPLVCPYCAAFRVVWRRRYGAFLAVLSTAMVSSQIVPSEFIL